MQPRGEYAENKKGGMNAADGGKEREERGFAGGADYDVQKDERAERKREGGEARDGRHCRRNAGVKKAAEPEIDGQPGDSGDVQYLNVGKWKEDVQRGEGCRYEDD